MIIALTIIGSFLIGVGLFFISRRKKDKKRYERPTVTNNIPQVFLEQANDYFKDLCKLYNVKPITVFDRVFDEESGAWFQAYCNEVCPNVELNKFSPAALESVIVHEFTHYLMYLRHIPEINHNINFQELLVDVIEKYFSINGRRYSLLQEYEWVKSFLKVRFKDNLRLLA